MWPHRERILKLSNLAVRIATESGMPDAPGEDETLVTREVGRLMADKDGKEDKTPQSVHHKRELEYLQGLRDQVKQTNPMYLPDPIHVIIIDYATPQVLVAFDRILKSWMSPSIHDDEDISNLAATRAFGLYNAVLYDVVRAIFEPLEYRYGGGGSAVSYTPRKEQLIYDNAERLSYLSNAIKTCIDDMYPTARNDLVILPDCFLRALVDYQGGKIPIIDPLGCVVWAAENKVEWDGPPCMNIVSIACGPISNFKDRYIVSGTKVQRVRYGLSDTSVARFLRELEYKRNLLLTVPAALNPYVFSGGETKGLPLALYQKAMMTPLPPGFNDDVKKALTMHRDELFRGGLQTSSAPTTTEQKSDAKKRTPKKKRRLAWLSNAATYRQFQSAQVRRRRT